MGLIAQRSDVDEVLDGIGGAELGDDVPGRGRVDDDEVVVGAPFDRLAHLPRDLADREDLLHARRGGRDEVEHLGERSQTAQHRHAQVEPQIFLERRLGVHRHREHTGIDLARA